MIEKPNRQKDKDALVLICGLNGNVTSDGTTTYTAGRRTRNATGTSFVYDGVNAVQELSLIHI